MLEGLDIRQAAKNALRSGQSRKLLEEFPRIVGLDGHVLDDYAGTSSAGANCVQPHDVEHCPDVRDDEGVELADDQAGVIVDGGKQSIVGARDGAGLARPGPDRIKNFAETEIHRVELVPLIRSEVEDFVED